jgi:hypothetical protein
VATTIYLIEVRLTSITSWPVHTSNQVEGTEPFHLPRVRDGLPLKLSDSGLQLLHSHFQDKKHFIFFGHLLFILSVCCSPCPTPSCGSLQSPNRTQDGTWLPAYYCPDAVSTVSI